MAEQFYREALAEIDVCGLPAKHLAELKLVAAFMLQREY